MFEPDFSAQRNDNFTEAFDSENKLSFEQELSDFTMRVAPMSRETSPEFFKQIEEKEESDQRQKAKDGETLDTEFFEANIV